MSLAKKVFASVIAPSPESRARIAKIVCVFTLTADNYALPIALVEFASATLTIPFFAPSSSLPLLGLTYSAPQQFYQKNAGVQTQDHNHDNQWQGAVISDIQFIRQFFVIQCFKIPILYVARHRDNG